jgi:hypothetical protein
MNNRKLQGFCSPHAQEGFLKSKTCYTKTQLIQIAKHFNQSQKKYNINTNVLKTTLLASLQKHLPSNESKWLTLDFMNKVKQDDIQEMKEQFRPTKPSSWYTNDRTWLNTTDINNVMNQYHPRYPSFYFFGVHPIDFNHKYDGVKCIADEICNFNLKTFLNKKYKHAGLILNLDKHYESGSHWVSVYFGLHPSLPNFGCYYIDSVGTEMPKEVVHLTDLIVQQIKKMYSEKVSSRFKIVQNKKQFQFKNTECGMFSIFFLVQLLKRQPFNKLMEIDIDDDIVHKFRNVVYKPM